MIFDQANEYIEAHKNKKYENFNNLTNPWIRNLLKALASNNQILQNGNMGTK